MVQFRQKKEAPVKGWRRLDPEANRRLENIYNKWVYLGRGELGHQEAGNGFGVRVCGEGGSVSGSVIRVGVPCPGDSVQVLVRRDSEVGCWLVSVEG